MSFFNRSCVANDPPLLNRARSGGDDASPPLSWTGAPAGAGAYAIVMQHVPKDTYTGVDEPSHYWLVWNIPAKVNGVARGNPHSLGVEGSNKDIRDTGYTPPWSPADAGTHEYTIWGYALDGPLKDLPQEDDINIGWPAVMKALNGHPETRESW